MEIDIDKAAVERAVADAVVNSAIGEKIKAAVNKVLQEFYNNPVDEAIKAVVREVAFKSVRDEYEEQVRAAVRKRLDDQTVQTFVDAFWDEVLKLRGR